jgi:YidC/Oxa1 family membrane protein insertase
MSSLFHNYLYTPLLHLLEFAYGHVIADFGVSIILITILIRFVLLPIFYKSAKDQTILQKIAPQIREIQKKHKDNKEQQVQEMMRIYKEHRVNPFSSILLLIVQLPILYALYKVFVDGGVAAAFPGATYTFLGLVNLAEPNLLMVLATVLAQAAQSWLLMRVAKKRAGDSSQNGNDPMQAAERISRKMIYFLPIVTGIILLNLPSAVALYWLTTSVFSAVQQLVINKIINKKQITISNIQKEENKLVS